MKTINRTKSLITAKNNLEFLFKLKSFPIFIGCTQKPILDSNSA